MKQLFALFTILLLLSACNDKPEEYPNITADRITTQLKWGLDFTSVNNILTEKFKLTYSGEIEQKDKNKQINVYEFDGGKYNNFETNGWLVAFKNDSLVSVMIKLSKKQPEENKSIYKKLREINNKELVEENSAEPNANRWYYEKDDKKLSEVLITMAPGGEGLAVLFSRTK